MSEQNNVFYFNPNNFKTFKQIREEARAKEPSQETKNNMMVRKVGRYLYSQGFIDVCWDEGLIVEAIEKNHIDVSEFEFPFGSYEAFKAVVQSGYYRNMAESILKEAEESEITKVGIDEYLKGKSVMISD